MGRHSGQCRRSDFLAPLIFDLRLHMVIFKGEKKQLRIFELLIAPRQVYIYFFKIFEISDCPAGWLCST